MDSDWFGKVLDLSERCISAKAHESHRAVVAQDLLQFYRRLGKAGSRVRCSFIPRLHRTLCRTTTLERLGCRVRRLPEAYGRSDSSYSYRKL